MVESKPNGVEPTESQGTEELGESRTACIKVAKLLSDGNTRTALVGTATVLVRGGGLIRGICQTRSVGSFEL